MATRNYPIWSLTWYTWTDTRDPRRLPTPVYVQVYRVTSLGEADHINARPLLLIFERARNRLSLVPSSSSPSAPKRGRSRPIFVIVFVWRLRYTYPRPASSSFFSHSPFFSFLQIPSSNHTIHWGFRSLLRDQIIIIIIISRDWKQRVNLISGNLLIGKEREEREKVTCWSVRLPRPISATTNDVKLT